MVSSVISPSSAIGAWWGQVKHDLRPFPGRWPQTWRIAVLCALMTLVSMSFQIPAAVLSCYVIFFVMKSDAAESTIMAMALVILVSIVVVVLVGLINLTIGSPAARLAMMASTSVLLLFLGVASGLGPLGGIIALVIAFVMALLVHVPVGELATRAVLYAWLMTSAPMALVISFSLVCGRPPHTVLADELARRLELAADSLQQRVSTVQLREALGEGIAQQQKRLQWLALFHLVPKRQQQILAMAVMQSYQILLASLSLAEQAGLHPDRHPDSDRVQRAQLATACRAAAQQLRMSSTRHSAPEPGAAFDATDVGGGPLQDIAQALDAMRAEQVPVDFGIVPEKTPFFAADAFTNPVYQRTAVKTTAAAMLCYLIYSGIQWEGIHTAMITCYVASLGSSGETVNKLMLRIIGCLVGAGLGVVLLVFFMPHMTSIVSLMVAVLIVTALAAWIGIGSERVSYAGIQIAFAFLLVSLQGFGPDVDLSVARDRVVGILLGNVVMYVAFTQIWPYSILHKVNASLAGLEQTLGHWQQVSQQDTVNRVRYAARAATELKEAHYDLSLALLEPKRLHVNGLSLPHSQQQLAGLTQRFERQVLGLADPS